MADIVITKMGATTRANIVISGWLVQLIVAAYGAIIFLHLAHTCWKYSRLLLKPCQLLDGLKNVRIMPSSRDREILSREIISNCVTVATSYTFHHGWTKDSIQKFSRRTLVFDFICDFWKFRLMIVPMV